MNTPDRNTPPDISLPRPMQMPAVNVTEADGARVTWYGAPTLSALRLWIYLPGGNVGDDMPGLSELTAAMLAEGAGPYTGAEIADLLDYNGAWQRSADQAHCLSIQLSCLSERLDDVLPVAVAMAGSPTFPAESYDVIRRKLAVRRQNELMRVSTRADIAARTLAAGTGHPIVASATPEQLMALTREQVEAHFARHCRSGNPLLYLAGGVNEEVARRVARAFAPLFTADSDTLPTDVPPLRTSPERYVHVDMPEARQSGLSAYIPVPIGRRQPDYIPLRIAVVALGGYFGSRLMLTLREEKGYTYGVDAALEGYGNVSLVEISAEVDDKYVEASLADIRHELERLADASTYDEEELERLRSYMLTSLMTQLNTPMSIVDYYAQMPTIGTPHDYFAAQQRAIRAATGADIAAMAARYLRPELLRVAVAGRR